MHAVWLYHAFSLSLRDVELFLAERGIVVSYETVRCWCKKFGESLANRLRRRRTRPEDKGYLDELFIRINRMQHYLWRAGGRGARHPRPATARQQCGQTLLSPAAERPSICSVCDRD